MCILAGKFIHSPPSMYHKKLHYFYALNRNDVKAILWRGPEELNIENGDFDFYFVKCNLISRRAATLTEKITRVMKFPQIGQIDEEIRLILITILSSFHRQAFEGGGWRRNE